MTIDISPELEQALEREAERRGTTPGAVALDSLQERFGVAPEPQNLCDFLGEFVGILDNGSQMSTDTGRKLTAHLVEQHKANRTSGG